MPYAGSPEAGCAICKASWARAWTVGFLEGLPGKVCEVLPLKVEQGHGPVFAPKGETSAGLVFSGLCSSASLI